MKLNINELTDSLKERTKDALKQIDVEVASDGCLLKATVGQKFTVNFDGKTFFVTYPELRYFFRALTLIKKAGDTAPFSIEEECFAKEMGVMLDCCRNAVRNMSHIKELIRLLALMGYNQIQLYVEDTYEVKNEPYFGYMRGRYTIAEMKEMDEYAASFGIEIVPCIQTLAHLATIFRWAEYEPIHDVSDILLIGSDRTYTLIENMISTLSECFRSRKIHLGMDEATLVGRGLYEDQNGPVKNRTDLILGHLSKIMAIADKYGYEPMIWSDMFFRWAFNVNYFTANTELNFTEDVIKQIPDKLRLVYWDYYSCHYETYQNMFRLHKQLTSNVMFAGGAWTWNGYTGQNAFSIRTTLLGLSASKASGCDKIMITAWGDDGGECSVLAVLPTLCLASEYVYGHGEDYADAFKALTNIGLDDYLTLDLPNIVDENAEKLVDNPSKYMLFNDVLGGLFDGYCKIGQNKAYEINSERIKNAGKNAGKYKYLFDVQSKLCDVLAIKFDLGARLRKAYKEKDKKELARLTSLLPTLVDKLEEFYKVYRVQWMKENKTIGFETQDYRLGGLIARVKSCKILLDEYLAGKISYIEELEQELLKPVSYNLEWGAYNNFKKNASANLI